MTLEDVCVITKQVYNTKNSPPKFTFFRIYYIFVFGIYKPNLAPLHQNAETKNVEKNMVESENVDIKKVEIKNVES